MYRPAAISMETPATTLGYRSGPRTPASPGISGSKMISIERMKRKMLSTTVLLRCSLAFSATSFSICFLQFHVILVLGVAWTVVQSGKLGPIVGFQGSMRGGLCLDEPAEGVHLGSFAGVHGVYESLKGRVPHQLPVVAHDLEHPPGAGLQGAVSVDLYGTGQFSVLLAVFSIPTSYLIYQVWGMTFRWESFGLELSVHLVTLVEDRWLSCRLEAPYRGLHLGHCLDCWDIYPQHLSSLLILSVGDHTTSRRWW
ncbi:hypothetical protein [Pseudomonas phage vB_PaeM_RP7]|nr:MAG: hypothetical protein [Pseudomonas phage RP4]WAB56782.1 putative endolysin [Pseudomonas phage vB_PaeM_RP15]WAB56896.1 hypothetical protein [Pseudomonas phage vB_PaeM_RP6]WAB57195.1 hypothetical protein [Pseudomonas phage vB_PaeM_RP7]WAB57332.1 hypothetical protein [Pseudomonas phage vB_PaeM_RP8]WAB57407.1 putative endolysin [Pseudomonas phage vB_PaeM_RP9]WAB57695.1 putative endolysin [Pseudomonas phage vB_PaeM_RP10]WAB57811.1 putative endolysin [Pseudomonas phage vB_PaeM_RP11]WAB5792